MDNTSGEFIIETRDLSKNYGVLNAVQGVSIKLSKGEIYGFLGLNGAGKTTTIRMLLGMIKPTSGSVRLFREPILPGGSGPWEKVGYLVEMPYSYPELTVRENLIAVTHLRKLKNPHAVDEIISGLRLNEYSHIKAKNLSLGNHQRLGLAKAMIHKPEMLILDEPSNGLDPAGIVEIRELLCSQAANHGVTIFISSHNLNEISKIATRIGIIHRGVLIKEIDTVQLNSILKKNLIVRVNDIEGALKELSALGYSFHITAQGTIRLGDDIAINSPEKINALLMSAGFPCSLVMVEQEDLETWFLRTIGELP